MCVGGEFFADKGEEGALSVGLGAIVANGLPLEVLSDNGSQYRVSGSGSRSSGQRYEDSL